MDDTVYGAVVVATVVFNAMGGDFLIQVELALDHRDTIFKLLTFISPCL